ncbi:endonuclease V [Halonotius terrestris]|uniref:Endonuclease V n=1 Tax=Halonotius terrestris TaxID=2487750 RepID=A0A8J8P9B6_9EURY|nr:endonuclease V [Halonotius terrestris]TQQ83428.1 endonuclease V [Halonotius terrestris]
MEPVHAEFLPDASLSREEIESLQREIADNAVFEDRFAFDPAAVQISSEPSQQQLTTAASDPNSDAAADAPLVAGVDQAFLDDRAISAVVVLQVGEVVERTHAVRELSIPYIPGLLAFREGGPIAAALATLDCEPDLLCFDGSGRIHYRQAGLATHLGVVFDTPSIGIAKNLLCGTPRESVDGRPAGWRTPIEAADAVDCADGTVIGHAYQSRQYESSNRHINPLYISPGHRVAAETTVDLVAALCDGYKLPEPTRLADSYADEIKAELS